MNQKEIKQILTELYNIDPNLRQYESELINVIQKFVALRPQAEINENFKQELRTELMKKAAELKPWPTEDARGFSWAKIFTIKNLSFTAIGAALLVVMVVINYNQTDISTNAPSSTEDGLEIQKLSQSAFGDFSAENLTQTRDEKAISGIGSSSTPSSQAPQPEVSDIGMIAPDFQNYKYIYEGNLNIYSETDQVLKKNTNDKLANLNSELLNSFGLGMLNLNAFDNLNLLSISLSQDKDLGYTIDVNAQNGYIGINENWDGWYNDQEMEKEYEQLTAGDIPSDEESIDLANNFLKQYQVNLDAYGQPIISPSLSLDRTKEPGIETYISNITQVVYPQKINNKYVYSADGEFMGLYVNINIRLNRVTGLTNLTTQKYQSSEYTTILDKTKLNKLIEKGGIYGYQYPENENIIEIPLNNPTAAYLSLSKYESGIYSEYLVPALAFPNPDPLQGARNVIVPLIEEFFEENIDGGLPLPMPAIDETVSSQGL